MNKDLIGISGKAGSGKNTVASLLQEIDHSFEQKAFAAKLKEVCSILTGIPAHIFEDQEFKKETMPEEWWYRDVWNDPFKQWSRKNVDTPIVGWYDHDGLVEKNEHRINKPTYRRFLQEVATEAMRDQIHPDVWVNALFADWKGPKMDEYYPSKWIITDVRFPNEYKAIKDRGGIILRVERPGVETMGHVSERALDGHKFDYVIYNDGSMPDLFKQVLTFYEKIIM